MNDKTTSALGRGVLAAAAAAALLSACGGSDGDSNAGGGGTPGTDPVVAGTDIPVSATTSASAAFSFVNGLASKTDDTAEPLVVGDATLAVSDTDEPSGV